MNNSFIDFYKYIVPKIKNNIIEYNKKILLDDNETIKDNLKIFAKLNESGKMIRGTLISLGYKITNKSKLDFSLPLATAYEIFETSILVHDDIIDNDSLRRGNITVHAYNEEKYKNLDNKDVSKSIALCIGDYGLYSANQIIVDNYANINNFNELFTYYNSTVLRTIRGEIIDVVTPFEEKNHILSSNLENNIMETYKLKTAYYSIVSPLILGMILGNSDNKRIKDIESFALPLGIVFQLQDDYLGIFAEENKLGKTVGSDIKEFKQTLLYLYTKNTEYYEQLLKYYGKEDYDLDKVKEIFIKSNAKEKLINKMNELYQESITKLNDISWLNKEDKKILEDLILYLKERKK